MGLIQFIANVTTAVIIGLIGGLYLRDKYNGEKIPTSAQIKLIIVLAVCVIIVNTLTKLILA